MSLVLSVDPGDPDPAAIAQAAALLRGGRLVAFPTETVYGLGANALDAAAVTRIFAAKGRPANNPLIVHVPNSAAARALAADWPDEAQRLAERFWPGPLTLVLPKRPIVPDIVTGTGPNVGLRVPAHPVALALLAAAQVPIAAPSANASLHISPTAAAHVVRSLGDRVDLILDAGSCPGGLESTVLDLSQRPPRVLRPGLVTLDELRELLPRVVMAEAALRQAAEEDPAAPLAAPGQLAQHYAPRVPLEIVAGDAWPAIERGLSRGLRIGWICLGPPPRTEPGLKVVSMPTDAAAYAAALYAALHELDDGGVDRILVTLPPVGEAWRAVHDRLRRAAHE